MPALHRKRGPMHEINIVPYVDVMLVLLVIFMVTAPLVTPGVIDLPTVGKAGQPKSVPIEIVVMEDQKLIVRERDAGGRLVSEQPVTRAALTQIIKQRQAKTPERREPPIMLHVPRMNSCRRMRSGAKRRGWHFQVSGSWRRRR